MGELSDTRGIQRPELKDGEHGIPPVKELIGAYEKDNPADDHIVGCQGVALVTKAQLAKALKHKKVDREKVAEWLYEHGEHNRNIAWDEFKNGVYTKSVERIYNEADQIIALGGNK